MSNKYLYCLLFNLIFVVSGVAQSPLSWVKDHPATISYSLDLTRVQQHELRITVDFPAVPVGAFHIKMPTTSPGRYAEHNFAKNVYDLIAYNGKGQRILLSREGINEWIITGHDGRVQLQYTLFANAGDGTYSGVDNRKLHLNMPATFLYGESLNDRPVKLILPANQRPEWTVASQLEAIGDREFAAPNYYYFYDSPTIVGDLDLHRWKVNSLGSNMTIEVAFMGEDTKEDQQAYVEWVKQIVAEQQRIYGELPAFDYGRYTFLCTYNDWINGDGMEHRNSTICSASVGLAEYADRLIGTVSHEFFHCWNVERIRPASLEPFDFNHANQSGELWFAEGFTSYYDDLTLVRTGIISEEDYFKGLGNMLNYVYLRPGRQHRSPIEMSQQAPFTDAATANDEDNFGNTFVSYYPYGAALALVLDLELRKREHNLDEFMRLVWQRYGKPEIPYHINDLQTALADLTEDAAWAKSWFDRHIYHSELPPLDQLLAPYGLNVVPANEKEEAGFYGLRYKNASPDSTGIEITSKVLENNQLYGAGVDRGSIITAINDIPITNVEDWERVVSELVLNRPYYIYYTQLGLEQSGRFTASVAAGLKIDIAETDNDRRKAWLNN